ncbi:MAG: hypothetical protein R3Y11_06645 [Pseudomonadota bacterium]
MAELKTVIEEIARKHGVILGRDDPVLIVHTMLEMYGKELAEVMHEIHRQGFAQYAQEMESEYAKWSSESHKRAEQILSVAMLEAQKITDAHVKTIKASLTAQVGDAIDAKMVGIRQLQSSQRWFAIANMITAGLLATAAMFFALFLK